LIKYKIIKYFLIFTIILTFIVFLAAIRLNYKPLDISYLSKYFPLLNKKISETYSIKSDKVLLDLDLHKNQVSLKINKIFIPNYTPDISNIKAKEAIISFKLTDLIKNNIIVDKITIIQGGLDINNIEKISNLNAFNNINEKYQLNSILLKNININIYEHNKKVAIFSNSNLGLNKNKKGYYLNNLVIDNMIFKNFNNNNNITINSVELIKKNQSNHIFRIKEVELENKNSILKKNMFIKNINKVYLKEIILNFNLNNFLTNAKGLMQFENYESNFLFEGAFNEKFNVNGDLSFDLDKIPLLTLLQNNFFEEKKIKINNASSVLFNGSFIAEIKNSLFENVFIKVFSKFKTDSVSLINLKNKSQIAVEDIKLEATLKNNIYEINNLLVNKEKQNLKMSGKFYNSLKNYFLNIETKKIEYNKVNRFLNNTLDSNLKYLNKKNSIDLGVVKNLKLNVVKNNNKIDFNILNSDFENITLVTPNNITLNVSSAKVIKKKKVIKVYSSKININSVLGNSYIPNLRIFSKNFEEIANNIEIKANIKTNYKFLNYVLTEIDYKNSFYNNLEGDIAGFFRFSNNNKDSSLNYVFNGVLENFSYMAEKNQKIPISLNDFDGTIALSNNNIKIQGMGKLNGSISEIKATISEDKTLSAEIDVQAKPSSFTFLGNYNFIEQGNTKLKVLINKKINSSKWEANISANLFSNEVKIDFFNFHKSKNRRGSISGVLYFDKQELLKIDKLDFLTEELLINADLKFDKNNNLKNIIIKRFIKEKNNFSADINFLNKNNSLISINGASIDIKDFINFKNEKKQNFIFTLNINNFYYNNVYFGNTFIDSKVENSELKSLKGNISKKENIYIRFQSTFNKQSNYNIINIEFDDFGFFLNNSSLSDSFIDGQGNATLYFKKLSLESGRFEVKNSSIKNSSFLARLLQLASFTGLLEILTNEGIPFDNIIVNFSKQNNVIKIEEAKLQGFSLGGKFKGICELDTQKINLEGIIIPAYAINSLLNKIPLIGQVITGIEGDGLIGVNFKVAGTYEKPNYNVNPLSILTPGIIRSIFDSFFETNDEIKGY
tara:strand:+ start:69 stop:3266 length:3198 start_codon:yes stop_codon:yes gene_type:complete